ncbi:MAG: class I SAM-dependent methyltransferase [Promethearchaeota archaeon]
MKSSKVSILDQYFASSEPRFDLFFSTNKGVFVGSPISPVHQALVQLMDSSSPLIQKNDTFLDAGSGDGRIVAIAAMLQLKAFGIEYNELTYNASLYNIDKLSQLGLFDQKPTIALGDFLETSPYDSLAVPFDSFDVIYSFETSTHTLAQKIIRESKKNTVFLYLSVNRQPSIVEGLLKLQTIVFSDNFRFLHVFKKE